MNQNFEFIACGQLGLLDVFWEAFVDVGAEVDEVLLFDLVGHIDDRFKVITNMRPEGVSVERRAILWLTGYERCICRLGVCAG